MMLDRIRETPCRRCGSSAGEPCASGARGVAIVGLFCVERILAAEASAPVGLGGPKPRVDWKGQYELAAEALRQFIALFDSDERPFSEWESVYVLAKAATDAARTPAASPEGPRSPMADVADALRKKAADERAAYEKSRSINEKSPAETPVGPPEDGPECTCDLGGPRHNGDCPRHPDSPEMNRPVDLPSGTYPQTPVGATCGAKTAPYPDWGPCRKPPGHLFGNGPTDDMHCDPLGRTWRVAPASAPPAAREATFPQACPGGCGYPETQCMCDSGDR